MRPLEILASLIAVFPIALSIFAPSRWLAIRFGAILFGVSLAAQCFFEGAHWQISPLYVAGFILIVRAFHVRQEGQPVSRRAFIFSAAFAAGLVLVAIGLSWAMPMFRLPQPTGPYSVGTRILPMVDTSRIERGGPSPSGRRELMVQAWYPVSHSLTGKGLEAYRLASYQRLKEVTAIASYRSVLKTHSYMDAPIASDGPYPVVLYNPGWQGERTEGTYQAEELASHGFIVFAIDHTFYGGKVEFSDGRVEDSRNAPELGNFENSTAKQQAALGTKFVHIEADDDSFVLDQVEGMNEDSASPWFHRIKTDSIGVMGFSIGGAVAAQTALQDRRVKAALNLDGWSFGDVQERELGKPWMILYEDRSQTLPTAVELNSGPPSRRAFWQFCQDDFDRVSQSMRAGGGWIVFIAGTQHVDFTDRSLFSPLRRLTGGGTLDPTTTHAIVNAYTLAFFSHTLRGSAEPLLDRSPSPFGPAEIARIGHPK